MDMDKVDVLVSGLIRMLGRTVELYTKIHNTPALFRLQSGAPSLPDAGAADRQHGVTASPFMLTQFIACKMKASMAPATATATATPTTTSTAATAPPEPKKTSKSAREGVMEGTMSRTMIRTIKVDFDQSAEMSGLIARHMDQQRWAFNMAVKEKLDDPRTTKYDLDGMLTKWRNTKSWLVHDEDALAAGLREACDSRVQRAGLEQGLDAVDKFMKSNGKKRANKSLWKHLATRDREREARKAAKLACNGGGGDDGVDGAPDGANGASAGSSLPSNKWSRKRNEWSHTNDLFKRKGEQRSLSVFKCPVYKGNNMVMLPGIGTVRVHGDVEGLDMRSFQLVETTKKTTRLTEDHNRTYRLHIQGGVKAPKPSESAVIRGVDMGIVHNATTADLDTGHPTFYDIPKDCRRSKNDNISKMYAELSRKRGGRGNRRIRQDANDINDGNGGSGGGTDTGYSNSNNTGGHNRNKTRKPKSRSYRELQRRIRKKREKMANRQTNWERHASKKIADGAGTVAMEDLNLNNMTARAKGKGSSAKTGLNREMAYSRPGTFQRQIEQSCVNAGVIVVMVDPKDTSITCSACGRKDKESRASQGRFRCTNDNCYNDINADVNAAYNIASRAEAMAAGRPGRSSEGARLQSGIAPGRSPDKAREPSAGGIARAPVKGKGTVYFCI